MKKSSKSGFTLVELISVIVLLSIILTIAVLSVSSIQDSVKERQYSNLKSKIMVAAGRYVNDTGINKVYVETLIQEGIIEADDETGNILDPRNNESMNCNYIDFSDENNPVLIESTTCDVDIVKDSIVKVKGCLTSGSSCATLSNLRTDWYGKSDKVVLGATSSNTSVLNLNRDSVTYTWISPLSPDILDNNKFHKVEVPASGYVNDVFEVIINKDGKTYSGSARVKIDAKNPVATDVLVDNPNTWKPSKTLTATITDNESGLAAYAITTSTSVPSSGQWTAISGNSQSISKRITSNGTYYVWVKDNAGNTNADTVTTGSITIQKIDPTPPSCTESGDNYSWTTSNVTLRWGCNDGSGDSSSGCDPSYSGGSQTYSSSALSVSVGAYTIKDNAGNTTNCPLKVRYVYIDKTKPVVSAVSISSRKSYNSRNVTVSVSGYDSHSGVYQVCIKESNSSSGCSWQYFSGYYSTSYTFSSSEGSGNSHTIYAFIKDSVGNISSAGSKSYRLYTTCSQLDVEYGLWGSCSRDCGGGYKYRDIYYYDYYLGDYCDTEYDGDRSSSKCNNFDCCGWTSDSCGYYGSCSTSCGWGSASRWCEEYSLYDGSYCGGYYDSTSCYEDYGCYVPEPEPDYPDPEPEPVPDIKCYLYALCYSGSGSSYKLYVNSNCTLKNTFATGCSKSDVNSSKFYAETSNGGSCVMGATFVENGEKASNTLKIEGGVGYYKRTSNWTKMNTC